MLYSNLYLDNYKLSSANSISRTYGSGTPDFTEMFERAKKAEGSSNAYPAKHSAKQPIDKTDKLYELCLDLESFLIKNLLNSMRNTVQKSGLVDDSFAGKMYEDMLYDEYSKDFTRNANFGLAEQAYRQLKNMY